MTENGVSVSVRSGEIEISAYDGGVWLELDQSRPGSVWHGDYCMLTPAQARAVAQALIQAADYNEAVLHAA